MPNRLDELPACHYADGLPGLAEAGLEPGRQDARDFLRQLQERGLAAQALTFLARILPAREQVWWCCRCLAAAGEDTPPVREALQRAVRWLREGVRPPFPATVAVTEENAQTGAVWLEHALAAAANPPGEEERQTMRKLGIPDLATSAAAGCAAMAAFFAGGQPLPTEETRARLQRFIQMAKDILHGEDRW